MIIAENLMARAAGPAARHQRWDERGAQKIQAQKATDVITRRRCHAAREPDPFAAPLRADNSATIAWIEPPADGR
jgi:hypothetical protein